MVDYKKDTGSTGEMMIRDTGTIVEFWIRAGNSTTFNNALPWGYTINGTTNNTKEFKYVAGSGWEELGSWNVTTSQTVTFRLRDTGTTGFGGPTTLSVTLNRAKAPNAPSTPTISGITHNSMNVSFTDGAANGASITQRQIARNTSNTTSGASTFSSDGSTAFTGLASGTTYYFWARTYNSEGWSAWSGARSATTFKLSDAPQPVVASDADQTSFWASFAPGASNGGTAVVEWQIAWNTSNTTTGASSKAATANTPVQVTGLQPGTMYYVWARGRNSAGWSAYSAVRTIQTVAGAYVLVGSTWKQAIPYVNVGGVWKLARPWSRVAGIWKQSG